MGDVAAKVRSMIAELRVAGSLSRRICRPSQAGRARADESARLNELVDPPPEIGEVGRLIAALQPVDEGAGIDRADGDGHGARQADGARSSFGSWSKRLSR